MLGVYLWHVGNRTRRANAALVGLGRTRRILVSDTLLAESSDDEIEAILAHELAHHVHLDIWRAIAVESRPHLRRVRQRRLGARRLRPARRPPGRADVAGLPLLLLASGAVSVALLPAAHALSRWQERRADRFALAVTGRPAAFVSAMRRLAAQNLAEDDPSRLVQVLFYSHPPIRERIAAALATPPSR